jgi:hypothetical protein
MIEKLAHAGEGWRAPTPFTISTMTYKVAVKAPAERADKLPLFHLYPYVLCVLHHKLSILCKLTFGTIPLPTQHRVLLHWNNTLVTLQIIHIHLHRAIKTLTYE